MSKIAIDKGLGLFPADMQLTGQPKTRHAVDNAKIDGFGHPSHLRGHQFRSNKKNLGCGSAVNILSAQESGQQLRVFGIMSQDPEIDLGVIGSKQATALGGNKSRTDPPPFLGADRDILQIGIA